MRRVAGNRHPARRTTNGGTDAANRLVPNVASSHDALFTSQDSIGARSWQAFATEAGVADAAAFTQCLTRDDVQGRVRTDAEEAAALRLSGTPALIIEGKLYTGALSRDALDELLPSAR